ncbi:MAG: TIGR04086 family membrane protein [Tenericutes bacterium]|jgi:putative membrane protein (TIGR04086 family)|nr:TIGR04086 family membrane protein [Mycoplasmatota bacterium]
MRYLKGLGYIIIFIIGLTFILTIFSYFDILNIKIINYFLLLIPLISIFFGGIYIGKNSNKRGYISGLKISSLFTLLLLLISYLGLNEKLSFRIIIYYIILALTSVFGSIIGINKQDQKQKK